MDVTQCYFYAMKRPQGDFWTEIHIDGERYVEIMSGELYGIFCANLETELEIANLRIEWGLDANPEQLRSICAYFRGFLDKEGGELTE